MPLFPPAAPPRPLRTKRNFKCLQLPEALLPLPINTPKVVDVLADANLVPTRLTPPSLPAGVKRRPPPLGSSPGGIEFLSPGGLYCDTGSARHSAVQATLSSTLAKLDMVKFDLRDADLRTITELGHGNGGSVMKVEHVPSGTIMAKKIVLIDAKRAVRKQAVRELQIMHDCQSEHIVSSYGAFVSEPNICICMEYMDKGSFDCIYRKIGPIDIEVVSMVALSVLHGLTYLYDVHRIIHRDIKPSNILCNSLGEIKLCDFGVSGELINSIAFTFVGTSTYMSPERIQGAEYSVKSDIWSLGISLIELAVGRFPFCDYESGSSSASSLSSGPVDNGDNDVEEEWGKEEEKCTDEGRNTDADDEVKSACREVTSASSSLLTVKPSEKTARIGEVWVDVTSENIRGKRKRKNTGASASWCHGGSEGTTMSIIELMHEIVKEPAPRLSDAGPEGQFSMEAEEFVDACLLKDPEERKTPGALLAYKWMESARKSKFDLKQWASTF